MDFTTTEVETSSRAFRINRGVPTDIIRVQRLSDHAQLPTYGSNGAAGLDLYADFSREGYGMINLAPGERRLIKTGISIDIPKGHYARVAPRSGLAYKNGIDVMAGVIDEDYRGEVGVILFNNDFDHEFRSAHDMSEGWYHPIGGGTSFNIKHGDRIAQLIIEKYTPCLVVEVSSLDTTERGSGGFGSTGT